MVYKSNLSDLIFLPAILFVGFITSYEDFKISKIKNKWILLGLSYSFLTYLFIWILCKLGFIDSYLLWNFDKWCINLLISIVIAYLLWHFKMWGAGDAKLFITYSALIPIGHYSKVYFNYYFASFFLLLTIFIPATIFIFLRSTFYFIKKFNFSKVRENIPKLIKEKLSKFNSTNVIKVFLGYFVFFLSFKILRQELQNLIGKILSDHNILMLISLLAFKQLSKFFKKNIKFIVVVLIILMSYVGFKMEYSWRQFTSEIGNTFSRIVIIIILFPTFKKIIDLYSERTVRKTTPFAPWMLLGALITWFL